MKRKVHSDKERLDWTTRLLWVPSAIRPIRPTDAYEASRGANPGFGAIATGAARYGGGIVAGGAVPVMLFWLPLSLVFALPVMLVVLPLRYARVLPWTIEAITYPWGKSGGPAEVQRWHPKGRREELERVIDEIAAALERGETRPDVAGATRVRA